MYIIGLAGCPDFAAPQPPLSHSYHGYKFPPLLVYFCNMSENEVDGEAFMMFSDEHNL